MKRVRGRLTPEETKAGQRRCPGCQQMVATGLLGSHIRHCPRYARRRFIREGAL